MEEALGRMLYTKLFYASIPTLFPTFAILLSVHLCHVILFLAMWLQMLPCFHQQSNSRFVLVPFPRMKGTTLWAVRPMLSAAAMLTEWLPTENAVRSLITIGQ